MDINIFPIAVFFTILFRSGQSSDNLKVELVQVLFRHGERTPMEEDYAALHYTDSDVYEPFGLGQLTDSGKQQAHKVGRMLRERYNCFLNQTYKPEEIFAQSAEIDRMQNSLQLVLAGLYSKSGCDGNVIWNPIPYRQAPEQLDVLFRSFKSKKFNQLLIDVLKLPAIQKRWHTFSDLLNFLKGQQGVRVNSTFELLYVFNTLLINTRMNIPLPTWYSDDLMSKLMELVILYGDSLTYTPEMRRVFAGPLVKTMLERMNLDGSALNPRKMYLYSGSDFNVAALARVFGVDDLVYPDFSSTLILEKLSDSDGHVYVRLVEWDAINEKLINRKVKECDEFCPADDFLKICRELIPTDREMRYLLEDFQGQDILDLYMKDPLIEEKRC